MISQLYPSGNAEALSGSVSVFVNSTGFSMYVCGLDEMFISAWILYIYKANTYLVINLLNSRKLETSPHKYFCSFVFV